MKVDRFLLGVGAVADAEITPEAREHLRGNFVAFFRSRGVISWDEWVSMSDETCSIAEEAAVFVEADRMAGQATMIARALGVASVADEKAAKDGADDAKVRAALSKSLDEIAPRAFG